MRLIGLSFLAFASSAGAFSPSSSAVAVKSANHPRQSTSLSMALTLYGSQGSRSPLVNWAANELDLSLEAGDLSKNPHPFGQIPCLTDDNDVVVFESGAILSYLQIKANKKGIDGDARAAEVTSWIAWANASLDPICFLETPEGKVYDTGLKSPNRRIEKLNEMLSESQFLVEGGFSLADVAVASYLLYVIQFFPDVELHSKWPHVVRYMKECAGREGYGKAFGSNVQGYCVSRLTEMESGSGKEKKLFGMF
mmetsp:Transcript_43864/g.92265  ORF Transcript_43864/g.92265 Transcript_43864/m.92265 type:complete len:252 (-) Transcript_43864:160-915(-)|eukprot:CAMPEP_0183739842 /NCGR_PEP_ID=MMETSP0737-20130205/58156_1 /TAXON_ID=385413 /ORGANISM="Thalassiosira miniscula, Strain CCMP1093" /LENGTH=251 /DNA_ID=CAMNT_0025974741 /DNA_START=35 /DNA_END=790 /DNA_ORIENTATION=+